MKYLILERSYRIPSRIKLNTFAIEILRKVYCKKKSSYECRNSLDDLHFKSKKPKSY